MINRIVDFVAARRKQRGWTPFKGPQLAAFLADAHVDQIGYGGAGGGGKTDLSLGLAMLRHRKTIFYRREYPQLQGAVDRSTEIYHKWGKWNEQKHRWSIRKGGVVRSVRFGAMQREKDMEKWRGTPCDFRVFDEAQNFLEKQVRFTMGWTRTSVPGQKCTDLLCFNPPTSPEGLWLIDFFGPWLDIKHPNRAEEGEIRYFAQIEGKEYEMLDGEPFAIMEGIPIAVANGKEVVPKATEPGTTKPKSRTFFKALVQDNPVYMSTGYMAQLQALPEPLRSQMLKGDFTAGLEDHAWQVIPTEWVKLAQARWEALAGVRPPGIGLSALGVDVARGGKDKTVLQARFGVFFPYPDVYPGTATPDGPAVAALVATALIGMESPRLAPNVDVIGVGSSVYDTLRGPLYNIPANGVNFAAASYGRDESGMLEYANVRAEAYWEFRQALDPKNGLNICLPPDRELLADLTAPRWSMSPQGILIEAKEGKGKINERLGRSPDKGDAVVLAWYQAPQAGYGNLPGRTY